MARNQTITRSLDYFSRAGRVSRDDLTKRAPELAPLASKTVALFGLGCLGAPSSIELARAGVGGLHILDHDIVDPGTAVRWPFGLSVAGMRKVDVIRDFIRRDYPYTHVTEFERRLGGARIDSLPDGSDNEIVAKMTRRASLIYDATAEIGVQHFLSDRAREMGIPYLAVDATFGGWGGRICRVDPVRTEGCWMCYQTALKDRSIEPPPAKPRDTVQPPACGDPTFTGAGFDLTQVALAAVRTAVCTLCDGIDGAYPEMLADVVIISFRSDDGKLIPPKFTAYTLSRHPNCARCNVQRI